MKIGSPHYVAAAQLLRDQLRSGVVVSAGVAHREGKYRFLFRINEWDEALVASIAASHMRARSEQASADCIPDGWAAMQ